MDLKIKKERSKIFGLLGLKGSLSSIVNTSRKWVSDEVLLNPSRVSLQCLGSDSGRLMELLLPICNLTPTPSPAPSRSTLLK
jgi:hypothetical protein